ncbi:cell division protein ZapE [Ectothiorhodospira mobilis]|uniref:cell division protein ZapE n=1 Tax=Ectothiorhodospira mobilis TaxID=195064 RepID=UPI0019089958|nr:cell division protein ZapE [Ectothiorhodospira mobilis]MBK1691901.1 cell division protein ZapE [Ectothiorhodospira mobilis]
MSSSSPQHRPPATHPQRILDPAQERAWGQLQRIRDALCGERQAPRRGIGRWFTRETPAPAVRGLYLWGGVGRGKTLLMDRFFEQLPFEDKLRLHFYRFMQQVHAELATLKDQPDPLALVTRRMARARVLCLDEFFVSDITDAMILDRLLYGLLAQGVTLVTTSNLPPEALYQDGLQRERFLPAIRLIQEQLTVFHLADGCDYRLRALPEEGVYQVPADTAAETRMADTFRALAGEDAPGTGSVEVEGRPIPVRGLAREAAWFDFRVLCGDGRGTADYVALARRFHTLLVSGVAVMDAGREDTARRFLALVDTLYDRGVNLLLTAEAPPEGLYRGQRLRFEYGRCVSRLQEMRTRDYLHAPHRP